MSRRPRKDEEGAIHHVFNRGMAKKPMFESRRDRRYFLSLLARAVKREELAVLAYCVLSTHYHIVVRSSGALDVAMQRIQSTYSRAFNRSRRRDGPLVRARYGSRRVDGERYLGVLLDYVHLNPVFAGLAARPEGYEFSSAWHRGGRPGPRWLEWRDRAVADHESLAWFVESRLAHPGVHDPAIHLLDESRDAVRAWMRRKSELADGTAVGLPVANPAHVAEVVDHFVSGLPEKEKIADLKRATLQMVMKAGLLNTLSGARACDVAPYLGRTASWATQCIRRHRGLVRESERYEDVVTGVAERVLERNPAPLRPRWAEDKKLRLL